MRHNIVVDISGRMEKRERKDAALAFSDGIQASVFVSGRDKLAVNDELGRRGVPRKRRGTRLLIAGVYLLLEDFLEEVDHLVIDDDLPGWGNEIKRELLGLIRQKLPGFSKSQLDVRKIGKEPAGQRADRLAWETRKKRHKPYKRLTAQDLITVIERIR